MQAAALGRMQRGSRRARGLEARQKGRRGRSLRRAAAATATAAAATTTSAQRAAGWSQPRAAAVGRQAPSGRVRAAISRRGRAASDKSPRMPRIPRAAPHPIARAHSSRAHTGRCHFSHDPADAEALREAHARKRQRGNGRADGGATAPRRQPTLLQKLFAKEIRAERSLLLQSFRVLVDMMPSPEDEPSRGAARDGARGVFS